MGLDGIEASIARSRELSALAVVCGRGRPMSARGRGRHQVLLQVAIDERPRHHLQRVLGRGAPRSESIPRACVGRGQQQGRVLASLLRAQCLRAAVFLRPDVPLQHARGLAAAVRSIGRERASCRRRMGRKASRKRPRLATRVCRLSEFKLHRWQLLLVSQPR